MPLNAATELVNHHWPPLVAMALSCTMSAKFWRVTPLCQPTSAQDPAMLNGLVVHPKVISFIGLR
jgi:hypothetical protein